MAGKAPLLLASLLFLVGMVGLGLTSAERAQWGPFQPPERPQRVIVVDASGPFLPPPALAGLVTPQETELAAAPQLLVAAPEATAEPTPEPTATPIPPLRVHGISADDAGVSAAGATPTPPPIRIGGIAADDAEATETPEPTETPEASATPEPSEAPE